MTVEAGRAPGWLPPAVVLAGLIAAIAMFTPASALAAYGHADITAEFGSAGTPSSTFSEINSLAYQEANKRLYVLGESGIYGFSIPSAGTFTPLGGAFPLSTTRGAGNAALAVDNTSGATGNNIYQVPDANELLGWSSAGVPLASPFPIATGGETCGVAVDNEGHVWIGRYANSLVREYEPSTGAVISEINVSNTTGNPCQIAVDPVTDDVYVAAFNGGNIYRYTKASGYTASTLITSNGGQNRLAINGAKERLYVSENYGSTINVYNSTTGALLETIPLGEAARGLAVNEENDTLYIASAQQGRVLEIPGANLPEATTLPPSGEKTLNGTAALEGAGEIVACYFEYGPGPYGEYNNKQNCEQATPYASDRAVSATIHGLEAEHVYSYRLVVENAEYGGRSVGAQETITPPPNVTDLETGHATNPSRTSIQLNASFEGTNEATSYFFEYGPSTTYTKTQPVAPAEESIGPSTGPTPISVDVSGLAPQTTYHFRVVARNSKGTTIGNDESFTTLPAVGGVVTLPATGLTLETMTLNGEFVGNGEQTGYYFEWGPTTEYGEKTSATPESAGAPTGPTHVSADLHEFSGYTIYHYRLVTSNAFGTTMGPDETVESVAAPLPEVKSTTVSEIVPTGASFSAEVNPNRWQTAYLFEWGTSTQYGASTPIETIGGLDNVFHGVVGSAGALTPGTIYHYRIVTMNFTGTVNGPDQTFITPNAPGIEGTAASSVGRTSAHFSALVSPNTKATSVHFEYGTGAGYGSSTVGVSAGEGFLAQQVGADAGGLTPGTTYHFRAVATNSIGTTVGPDQTLTTAAAGSEAIVAPDCAKFAQAAKRKSRQASKLSHQASSASPKLARSLRKQAAKLEKQAREQDRKAATCGRSSGGGS